MTILPHKGKVTTTYLGSRAYSNYISDFETTIANSEKFVPAGYAHRPDLIAELFLGGAKNWWVLMDTNGLFDPFESLKLSERIALPND